MFRVQRFFRWIAPIVALVLLFGNFGTTQAAPRQETTPPGTALTRYYKLSQEQLRQINELLKKDDLRASEVEKVIAYLKKAGKNTADLEKILAAYNAKLATAHTSWQQAADILKTHAGFDDTGKVTDSAQALATLKSARSSIEASYKAMHSAEELLRYALRKIGTHR